MRANLPLAREDRLIIKVLDEEVLVYDLNTDKAHCLNQTAASVWKHCDGKHSIVEIAKLVGDEFGVYVSEDVVWLALEQLRRFKLLTLPISTPATFSTISRREVIRSLRLAAVVSIPLITSIIAPIPSQAASCGTPTGRDNGCPCLDSSECMSGCCRAFECKPGEGNCT